MQRPSSITQTEKQPGLLDHLSAGMSILLAFPHLMLIPILIDLYLLLAPRISSVAITERLATWSRTQDGDSAADVAKWFSQVGDWDVSRLIALLVPSVVDGLPPAATFEPYGRGHVAAPMLVTVLAGIGLILVGTGLFVGLLVWLAQSGEMIREQKSPVGRLILDRWLKFLGFAAIMVAIAMVGGTALIVPTMMLAVSEVGVSAIIGFLSLVFLVLLVVTMFVPEAIVVDGAGPLRAIRSSAAVVSGSFWQAMGLFVISFMFTPGLLSIWEEIAGDPVGLGIAIVGNAALITSLALASLSFYRSRSEDLAPVNRAA
jgi:hypothetical protein